MRRLDATVTAAHIVRPDWRRVLIDLEQAGYKLSTVAGALGLNAETLRAYRNRGCTPNYAYGRAIVGLWCQVMGRAKDHLPEVTAEAPPHPASRGAGSLGASTRWRAGVRHAEAREA